MTTGDHSSNEIHIRHTGEYWIAYTNIKAIGQSKCKDCIVGAMRRLTRESTKYTAIIVFNAIGKEQASFRTGAAHARNDQEISRG